MTWPTINKKPLCFLVYANGDLWTPEPVSRDEASRVFNLVVELAPKARVQILGVHTLNNNSQKALSR